MNRHPGGQDNTESMLEHAAIPKGARILDMGAGGGETVLFLRRQGYCAQGIDLEPRSSEVLEGDFHHTEFPDGSFDVIISQCSFFVSGNAPRALQEAHRLLRKEGILLLSDLFAEDASVLLKKTGFEILYQEDLTPLWKEYYIDALWREENVCTLPRIRCTYQMVIGRRKENGSA